ncbi:hypothetical protein Vretimale_18005 [Volvox reticuliferus]|uniref:Uncharacterized protein n=1 Tax=Volvox reticuliferus TaxID=1737510 RepID=A0A8J4D061_9CHLO|nr:hypothetical protein Vretifemale_17721 [Volvox reticuliferus]GIM15203.1 hypothetical protein Vretimale_18005 [Volvox reticuliferus]
MVPWTTCIVACLFASYMAGGRIAAQQVDKLTFNSLQEYLNNEPKLSLTLQLTNPSYDMLARTDMIATVFLPTSDAITTYLYEEYGVEDLAELWSNPALNKLLLTTFNSVLLPYHIVLQRTLTSSQLITGTQLMTNLGRPVEVVRSSGRISIQGGSNAANIVTANQMLANGLVICHLIDAVLLAEPALLTPSPPVTTSAVRRSPVPRVSSPPPSWPPPLPAPARRSSQSPPSPPPPSPSLLRPQPRRTPQPSPPPPPTPRPLSPPSPRLFSPSPPRRPAPLPSPSPRPRRSPPSLPVFPNPPTPWPRPSPSPFPLPASRSAALDLVAELRGLGAVVNELVDLLSRGPQLAEVLPILARLSPHLAGHLSRSNATMATLFLPSADAFSEYLSTEGDLSLLSIPALITLYRRTLTVTAYHAVPGGAARRMYTTAALTAAASAAGGGATALASLVPDATLGVMILSGRLQVLGADGGIGAVTRADLTAGQRLVVHVIDQVVLPPPGSEMPLNGAKPQGRLYPSALSWMSDPTNLDATVFWVLRALLPPNLLAALDDPDLAATLFIPVDNSLLSTAEALNALSAPRVAGAEMLATALKACVLPGESLVRETLTLVQYSSRVKTSAAGTPLLFMNKDSTTLVNGVPIMYFDRPAGKAYVQILPSPLRVDYGTPSPPPPPKASPPQPPPPRRRFPPPSPGPSPSPSPPSPPAPPQLPFASLLEAFSALPELSSLAALYDIAVESGVFNTIMDSALMQPYTMFLPNDQAVDSYLDMWEPGRTLGDMAAAVRADARALVRLLSPHTFSGRRLLAASFGNTTTLTTGIAGAAGARLRVSLVPAAPGSGPQGGLQLVNLCCGTIIRGMRPDVQVAGSKGVIHVIDTFIPSG